MSKYGKIVNQPVPQTVQTAPEQVENSAGGFVYRVPNWEQLQRFLILGSTEGNYYFTPQKLTRLNVDAVVGCIQEDGLKVIEECVFVRETNRALKVDSCIYTLALCVKHGTPEVKKAALYTLWKIAQTGTQLFQFVGECESLGIGWGRMFRAAIGDWYTEKPLDKLAYQMVKYQQREGWSHRDLLRLAHVKPDEGRGPLLAWAVGKSEGETVALPALVTAFEAAKTASVKELPDMVREYGLTREMLPTSALNDMEVWRALLEKMPGTAMVRNLGKMSSVGLLEDKAARGAIEARLSDPEWIAKARIHPLAYFVAMRVYASGRGVKGSLTWHQKGSVVDALDEAVRLSFGALPKITKRVRLAVDISGSMAGSRVCNEAISLQEASAIMSLAFLHQADDCDVMRWSTAYSWITASKKQRVDDLVNAYIANGGGTAMEFAFVTERPADLVVVFTDNETWAGNHADQAWGKFQRANPGAKAVVLSMTANGFRAIPSSPNVLNCAGFDTSAPQVVASFAGMDVNQGTVEDE